MTVAVYKLVFFLMKLKLTFIHERCGSSGPFPDAAQVEDVVALTAAPHCVPVSDSVATDHTTVAATAQLLHQLTGLETWGDLLALGGREREDMIHV